MRRLELFLLLAVSARAGELTGVVRQGGQPVPSAIVYLAASSAVTTSNLPPTIVDVKSSRLVPRVQVARAGAAFILQNSDPRLHMVRVESLGQTNGVQTVWRVAMPYAGFEKSFTLPAVTTPTLWRVCGENGEEGMVAYLAVLPHPWAALSDATGRYRLQDVPAGTYRLCAWHEALGTLAQEVRASRWAVTADFDFADAAPPLVRSVHRPMP